MPSQLARDLHVGRDLVCAHVARLTAVGLITRRRSGSRCYCLLESPYSVHALSGQLSAWLREVLAPSASEAPTAGQTELRGVRVPADNPDTRRTVFEVATTFANLRRLNILRYLAGGRTSDAQTIMRELSMSRPAATRQLAKLIRRGYLRKLPEARHVQYQLLPGGKSPLHARVFQIVSEHWDREAFHS